MKFDLMTQKARMDYNERMAKEERTWQEKQTKNQQGFALDREENQIWMNVEQQNESNRRYDQGFGLQKDEIASNDRMNLQQQEESNRRSNQEFGLRKDELASNNKLLEAKLREVEEGANDREQIRKENLAKSELFLQSLTLKNPEPIPLIEEPNAPTPFVSDKRSSIASLATDANNWFRHITGVKPRPGIDNSDPNKATIEKERLRNFNQNVDYQYELEKIREKNSGIQQQNESGKSYRVNTILGMTQNYIKQGLNLNPTEVMKELDLIQLNYNQMNREEQESYVVQVKTIIEEQKMALKAQRAMDAMKASSDFSKVTGGMGEKEAEKFQQFSKSTGINY